MDLIELRKKLIAAARANAPSEQVPYAFEKRVMARLAAKAKVDEWAWWGRALWRGAAACAAVTLFCTALAVFSPRTPVPAGATADLEEAVLALVNDAESSL